VESVRGLFVFIGARPSTEWIDGQLAEDEHGFLLTGSDVPLASYEGTDSPLFLETSRPVAAHSHRLTLSRPGSSCRGSPAGSEPEGGRGPLEHR
jgi:hypothetical protein